MDQRRVARGVALTFVLLGAVGCSGGSPSVHTAVTRHQRPARQVAGHRTTASAAAAIASAPTGPPAATRPTQSTAPRPTQSTAPAIAVPTQAPGWSVALNTLPPPGGLTSVSCLSDTFCIAAGGGANQAQTTGAGLTESWDGESWSAPSVAFPPPASSSGSWPVLPTVTCTEGPFCVVAEATGMVTNGDGTDWITAVPLPAAPSVAPNPADPGPGTPGARSIGVSCPTAHFCALVDNTGQVWTWSHGRWLPTRSFTEPATASPSPPAPVALYAPGRVGISCPSPTSCTAVVGATVINWDGSSWSRLPTPWPSPGVVSGSALSCPTATLCAIVSGSVVTYRNGGWSTPWAAPQAVDPGGSLDSISCPTPAFCMAADTSGDVVSWNGSTWSPPVRVLPPPTTYPGIGTTVSCSSSRFCMVVNGDGDYATFTGASPTG